ncbi:GntR family transcriptional regulator [Plantactinospora soyae]|uniref:DNA-binding transcriptional regulator YhcF (GntR family) n=1 Tax=Plantactinospora soyae TaxID=1544732 RepID=A0A927R112_9ACTN|nr:GntR family transcriptional regulator [Plantactinospora soyae]MBE1489223.1 DNA-binding transcriptional regulator YhcF (GntR family) [Plantactinospora soyae]
MSKLSVESASAVPVYRQIVEQIRFLVESGGLRPGERLPPVRRLADNLGVNRNTVVKAYATLREMGMIETRGASGTVIATPPVAVQQAPALRDAVLAALHGGMSPEQVRDAAYSIARQGASGVRAAFVECNEERAQAFSKELSARLHIDVRPGLLTELDTITTDVDLVITTFFHLAKVRQWARTRQRDIETAAIVVAPHIRTLMKVAELPAGARVGVRYSTEHQSAQVRDWLATAGSAEVVLIASAAPVPADLAVLVVPSEDPRLGEGVGPGTEVVEFGNVLDEGSIHMVATVVDEIRARRWV